MSERKILYLLSTLRQSGPTNQLYNLISCLNDNFRVAILTLSTTKEVSNSSRFEEMGVDISTLDVSRKETLTKGRKKLANRLNSIHPDIVHSHGVRSDILSAISIKDFHTVSTIHNDPCLHYPLDYGRIKGRLIARMHTWALPRIDTPVACSNSVRASLKCPTTVVCNGVNLAEWQPADDECYTSSRNTLNIPQDRELFLYIGSFNERKRPELIINAFQQSSASESSALVMVGDGPLYSKCKSLIRNEEHIHLPGYVDDLNQYLAAADYYVSASTAEGLPLGVLEALASGLPVCLSGIAPHIEILRLNEKAGYVFEPNSEKGFASALERITEGNYANQSESARGIIEDRLNSQRMANEYEKIYQRVV